MGSIPIVGSFIVDYTHISEHRRHQQNVIRAIEKQIAASALRVSTVTPVSDYEHDSRLCLTGVHIPHESFKKNVLEKLILPLQQIEPNYYFYYKDAMHITVKNVRVINDPPHFTPHDITKAKKIFADTIPKHAEFNVYFYRLLLFPNNLALVGTTDPELDALVHDLDSALEKEGIPDDKVYANTQYFFCNITLARFNTPPSDAFKQKVRELSSRTRFDDYTIDSVALVQCNAAFKNPIMEGVWRLQRNNS